MTPGDNPGKATRGKMPAPHYTLGCCCPPTRPLAPQLKSQLTPCIKHPPLGPCTNPDVGLSPLPQDGQFPAQITHSSGSQTLRAGGGRRWG